MSLAGTMPPGIGGAVGASVPDATTSRPIAGRFMQAVGALPAPALRGAFSFGAGLLRGDDVFRSGIDSLTAAYPKAGIAAQTVILPDRMTAAGTLDEARARGLYK